MESTTGLLRSTIIRFNVVAAMPSALEPVAAPLRVLCEETRWVAARVESCLTAEFAAALLSRTRRGGLTLYCSSAQCSSHEPSFRDSIYPVTNNRFSSSTQSHRIDRERWRGRYSNHAALGVGETVESSFLNRRSADIPWRRC